MIIWNQWFFRPNFQLLSLFLRLMRKYKEICCVNTSRNSHNFLNNRNWPNLLQCWFLEEHLRKDNSSLHFDDDALDDMKGSCRRVFSTSKWGEDRPSLGCEGLLSSRMLRCGYHDRIFISWRNSFLGSYRERNQQIRNRNVRRNCCCKCWEQRCRETSREG